MASLLLYFWGTWKKSDREEEKMNEFLVWNMTPQNPKNDGDDESSFF